VVPDSIESPVEPGVTECQEKEICALDPNCQRVRLCTNIGRMVGKLVRTKAHKEWREAEGLPPLPDDQDA